VAASRSGNASLTAAMRRPGFPLHGTRIEVDSLGKLCQVLVRHGDRLAHHDPFDPFRTGRRRERSEISIVGSKLRQKGGGVERSRERMMNIEVVRERCKDLLYLLRRPGLLLRSLIAVFVIMPVVAVVLDLTFDFRPTVEVVLVALALSPVPPILPKKETKLGGNASYALGLMAILSLLSIVAAPLAVELLGRFFGRSYGMAPGAIARVVLTASILPLIAGMAVRALVPGIADRIEKPVGPVARVLLPVAVLALVAGSWQAIWAAVATAPSSQLSRSLPRGSSRVI
jgi:Sodium Bile acid symporter family